MGPRLGGHEIGHDIVREHRERLPSLRGEYQRNIRICPARPSNDFGMNPAPAFQVHRPRVKLLQQLLMKMDRHVVSVEFLPPLRALEEIKADTERLQRCRLLVDLRADESLARHDLLPAVNLGRKQDESEAVSHAAHPKIKVRLNTPEQPAVPGI